jgi:hypothetical protein
VGNLKKGKRALGRCRHRGEDNIYVGVKEMGWKELDYIRLAENRQKQWVLVRRAFKLVVL